MSKFVENPIDFAADCGREHGQCGVARENFHFLDNGNELAAVGKLQRQCGHVVIIPDTSGKGHAVLYHTSCQRMTDVVTRIFQDKLGPPASLPQSFPEMTVGELYRRSLAIPYDRCRVKVEGFGFGGPSQG
jgi:hypothetical protein